MPKNRKSKHYHQQSNRKTNTSNHHTDGASALSHAEIWDDSALIRSWNEAVAEYEYYHSLAAQGLDVDAVLDAAEEAERSGGEVPLGLNGGGDAVVGADGGEANDEVEAGEVEEGEIGDGEEESMRVDEVPPIETSHQINGGDNSRQREPTTEERQAALRRLGVMGDGSSAAVPAPTVAARPTTSAPDDTLENVKMAYYWAGYYSGLYDGQRQQQATAKDVGGNEAGG